MTLPFVALHDMNPNAGTLQITGSGAWQTSSAGGVTGGVSTGGVRAGVGISAGAVATAGAGVGNSSSAEEHAIQLVGICCATALRNAGFDATTGHAAMLFAQIAGARLEALARACSDASLLRGEGIGVARLEYHDPGRNVIDFANNHNGNETIAATTTPTPTPTVSTTSTNSGAESLLLRFSSSLVSAALSDLDDDTLVELRRTALASVALAKNNPPPTSSVLPAITSNSSAAELSSSNQPLPSIPIMFIDGTSSSFPRIKPGPFPVRKYFPLL
ncbi:hypothetical protein BC830DRAFT_956346 [Chytriomyces sp. MP71]|nr:hypothetical protein BC830DRAFT_956346 [Chytriomyces sp. MP71]